ncbi:MAG: ABC transporter substrate-binding protein [Myxococcota bacterium]
MPSSDSGSRGSGSVDSRNRPSLFAAGLLALLLLCSWGTPAIAEEPPPAKPDSTVPGAGPTASIDGLHAELLEVMKNADRLGYAGREEELSTVIPAYFDVDFMAKKSLGRHWKSASPEARERYLAVFSRFMVANYAGRFDGYSGQSFHSVSEEDARLGTKIVKARLANPEGDDVALDYRLREVDGHWKVIDVYLDGTVSELALRRSEFMSIVKREDLDALLVALDEKIANFAAGKGS